MKLISESGAETLPLSVHFNAAFSDEVWPKKINIPKLVATTAWPVPIPDVFAMTEATGSTNATEIQRIFHVIRADRPQKATVVIRKSSPFIAPQGVDQAIHSLYPDLLRFDQNRYRTRPVERRPGLVVEERPGKFFKLESEADDSVKFYGWGLLALHHRGPAWRIHRRSFDLGEWDFTTEPLEQISDIVRADTTDVAQLLVSHPSPFVAGYIAKAAQMPVPWFWFERGMIPTQGLAEILTTKVSCHWLCFESIRHAHLLTMEPIA